MSTPFGIRRRIRRFMGWSATGAPEAEAPKIEQITLTVIGPKSEEQGQAPAGSPMVSASAVLKRPIASGCSDSTCATCRVEVLEGAENLSAQHPREKATLKQNGHPMTMRLACMCTIERGSVKVRAFELM
jgi:ferredoxin